MSSSVAVFINFHGIPLYDYITTYLSILLMNNLMIMHLIIKMYLSACTINIIHTPVVVNFV